MREYVFNYSDKFKCKNKDCLHNCCIGWKISINKKTLNKYKQLSKTDSRFVEGKTFNKDGFILENERCPFIEKDNLCYIINNYGENHLCTTCKTHPRFKSFFSSITETGLGLYCEEAGKQILSFKPKMKTILVKQRGKDVSLTPFEKKIFAFRKKALKIIQNRKLPFCDRLNLLFDLTNVKLEKNDYAEWIKILFSLEKLDNNRDELYSLLLKKSSFSPIPSGFELEFEQLLSYLVYRHVPRAIDNLDLSVRLAFCILVFKFILELFSTFSTKSIENLVESARIISSEIECSDQNVITILNTIEQLISFI